MSNKRRAERRDAHGAPVRTRREITIAVLTALAVVLGTAALVFVLKKDPPSAAVPSVPSTSVPASSASTAPTGSGTDASTSSTTGAATTSTAPVPASSSTSTATSTSSP